MQKRKTGLQAALLSTVFLGLAPVFGKQAINLNITPLAVVGLRTFLATILLLAIMVIFRRKYLYIYPAGLLGCGIAGLLNGVGSIFYYAALGRVTASVGQLLFSLYPLIVAIVLILDSQPPSRFTIARIFLATVAVILLTYTSTGSIDIIGVAQMLLASVLYALHIPINQKVLYDIPAPTVTLYTLLAMSLVVFPAYLIFDRTLPGPGLWWPVIALTLVTFLSRLFLFLGVKHLGGMQTSLLGLLELLVAIGLSIVWLKESLTPIQWVGAGILFASIFLVYFDKFKENQKNIGRGSWLSWLTPPGIPNDLTFRQPQPESKNR
ncbi:MAG: DMT family transporter [Anaerolineae bacterium]|nr:DMT family transporter [Anaerolineae bacterium]MDK1080071.1 DMT family transporter [Anaerolineae bacterium]MDK1118776.1 DMT family transporter [Anaerolineae bacterium]